MKLKFYYCSSCGKIVSLVKDSGTPTLCCGKPVQELVPSVTDKKSENHVPIIKVMGNTISVTVGSKIKGVEAENYIEWVLLQSGRSVQKKWLGPGSFPNVDFAVMTGEKVEVSYDCCDKQKLEKIKL